ncbi:23S rRNA (adenine(2503)-C(2))-methyltransferase RlmN [uncultured Rubinisphaera sp.]|uniref:23S rRNA (adenine(2503)-C(2))-methyltransferase RlmN n=1 Tax=uncultured Rubinisphaera sp. TaxID=1678686 RepID=UPI0030DC1376
MIAPLPTIYSLSFAELQAWCVEREIRKFRAEQIFRWVYQRRARSFAEMTDVPESLREQLSQEFVFFQSEIESHQIASDRTEKLLLKYRDGEFVECVLMREPKRNTICISTQVGCAMGCVFCASGLAGLTRNLTTAEIVEQIARMVHLQDDEEQLTNVVVMGIGEPLANLPNLLPALDRLHEPIGWNMGTRRVTVSTVGLPEKIRQLANAGKRYSLAVSLHAPNDSLRNEIVPVNKNIGIKAILDAADDFFDITGRRVTFEYVLLAGKNDSIAHARELAQLLRGRQALVNLIPMNAISLLSIHGSTQETAREFVHILEQSGITATIRKRKGADIDAACGQLRLPHVHEQALHTLEKSS